MLRVFFLYRSFRSCDASYSFILCELCSFLSSGFIIFGELRLRPACDSPYLGTMSCCLTCVSCKSASGFALNLSSLTNKQFLIKCYLMWTELFRSSSMYYLYCSTLLWLISNLSFSKAAIWSLESSSSGKSSMSKVSASKLLSRFSFWGSGVSLEYKELTI